MTDTSSLRRLLADGREQVSRAQQRLAADAETQDWEADFEQGSVSFANGVSFDIQVIGTESTETWLWAWANASFGPWPAVRSASEAIRAHGREHGIDELVTARMPVSAMDAHTAGAVGLLLTGAEAYFAGAHDGGRIALLLTSRRDPSRRDPR